MILMLHYLNHHLQSSLGTPRQHKTEPAWKALSQASSNKMGPTLKVGLCKHSIVSSANAIRIYSKIYLQPIAAPQISDRVWICQHTDLCINDVTNNVNSTVAKKLKLSQDMWAGLFWAMCDSLVPEKCFLVSVTPGVAQRPMDLWSWQWPTGPHSDEWWEHQSYNSQTITFAGPSDPWSLSCSRWKQHGWIQLSPSYSQPMAHCNGACQDESLSYRVWHVPFKKLEYQELCSTAHNAPKFFDLSAPKSTIGQISEIFPQAIVHDPWQWSGLDIPSLFMEQISCHILSLLKMAANSSKWQGVYSRSMASYSGWKLGSLATYLHSNLPGGMFHGHMAETLLENLPGRELSSMYPTLKDPDSKT